MKWVWTWGGTCFGYLEGENLWTVDGKHVGKLRRDVIYGPDGHYLGELRNGNRLITEIAKRDQLSPAFTPYASRRPTTPYANCDALELNTNHEDFPRPESLG
jgi:4-fold beta flower protein